MTTEEQDYVKALEAVLRESILGQWPIHNIEGEDLTNRVLRAKVLDWWEKWKSAPPKKYMCWKCQGKTKTTQDGVTCVGVCCICGEETDGGNPISRIGPDLEAVKRWGWEICPRCHWVGGCCCKLDEQKPADSAAAKIESPFAYAYKFPGA